MAANKFSVTISIQVRTLKQGPLPGQFINPATQVSTFEGIGDTPAEAARKARAEGFDSYMDGMSEIVGGAGAQVQITGEN